MAEYLALVQKAGLYGVMPFDARLKGHPSLLGYIHGDEPDLPHQVSDADVVPAPALKINRSTPLWKIVDGVSHSWSVLDPLDKAVVTIRLKQPVTVESLAVWPTISAGLAVAKEVSFEADGKEILRATLEAKKGQQKFPLAKPATFKELKLTVLSTYPGEQAWGSIGEIEGFDAAGKNVLLAPPRYEPRAMPAKTLKEYRAIKAADPTRPVFMTLTGHFHPHFKQWSDQQRASLYPEYIQATDVVGYDIYPIYGWNKPEWMYLVYDATQLLAEKAGPRPVYAWIETSKGGQWTGPLEQQKDVTPAHIRAETWMAICGGATAIGYFTHVWKPSYQQFGVPEENRKALRRSTTRSRGWRRRSSARSPSGPWPSPPATRAGWPSWPGSTTASCTSLPSTATSGRARPRRRSPSSRFRPEAKLPWSTKTAPSAPTQVRLPTPSLRWRYTSTASRSGTGELLLRQATLPTCAAASVPRDSESTPAGERTMDEPTLQTTQRRVVVRAILLGFMSVAIGVTGSAHPAEPAAETLYNGIVLPKPWPPRVEKLSLEPMPVPYLRSRRRSSRSASGGSCWWTIS